jgi:hypothetical protein
MYRTQLVTTKGEVIRTFISQTRPAYQCYTAMGNVEITYTDSESSFVIIGNFNVIVEKIDDKESIVSLAS